MFVDLPANTLFFKERFFFGLLLLLLSIIGNLLNIYNDSNNINFYSFFSKNCDFKNPSVYRLGPYPNSIEWCIDNNKDDKKVLKLNNLIKQMKSYSNDNKLDILMGAEFGSNLRVIYLRGYQKIIINPMVKYISENTMECIDSIDGKVINTIRIQKILIMFLNEDLKNENITLNGKNSCLIQLTLEQF